MWLLRLQFNVYVPGIQFEAMHEMLNESNAGYKINADNCDCDALNYTPEEGTAYTDTPFSTTSESGVSPCRTKCSQTNGCVGFTVSATNKDNTVSCKIFKAMTNKKEDQYTAAFKLVGCQCSLSYALQFSPSLMCVI
jgi:hypothetical protein